eukprot:3934864-Amphidinium_carterae.1
MATESRKHQRDRDNVLGDDREIVLAAVQGNGLRLEFAAESCRGDREIVLVAVKQTWRALEYAAEGCRGDREIVLAA